MTEDDNISIGTDGRARDGRPFKFVRIRAGEEAEFFPGAGTTLRYANRDVDTLTLPLLPDGLVQAGDAVRVEYLDARVFQGTAEKIVDMKGRGDERVQTVTCHGPWGPMNRLVFRQKWGVKGPNGAVEFSTPRVVLNQTALGLRQNMTDTVREICSFAAQKCGFAYSDANVDVDSVFLPLDETRDQTCASALQRELRFFPRKIVRFDYGAPGLPAIHVDEPGGGDASYVEEIPMTARKYEYTAHPVKCVDVYTSDVDVRLDKDGETVLGAGLSHQFFPNEEALLEDLDCLHAYVPLAPGSASTSWKSFDCVVEELPQITDKSWWIEKHPRLQGVDASQFTIVGSGERTGTKQFDRIAKASAAELKEAGIEYEVETFRIRAKIDTGDDMEEDVILEMTFLMTNGTNRTYTWQTGSSSTAGETLPEGLAQAIFNQRSKSLLNEEMTVRLGDAFPVLGDGCDGLLLQEYEVDCQNLTADLHFGQPEHLSVEDMRDLLNGFRQRGYASNAPLREDGEPDEDETEKVGGIPPLSTSAWSPGIKVKTTIKQGAGGAKAAGSSITMDASGGGGSFDLKTADVKGGDTVAVHTLTYTDEDGEEHTYQVLADKDIEIKGGGSGGGKAVKDISFAFDDESGQLKATLKFSSGSDEDGGESTSDKTVPLPLWKYDVVSSMSYSDKKFKYKTSPSVATTDPSELDPTEVEDPVFEAVEHEPEN